MAAAGVDIQLMVSITLQNTLLAATASLVGQVLTSHQQSQSLTVDWAPVALFMIWTFISTPPNYLWQQHLEDKYPSYLIESHKATMTKARNVEGEGLNNTASVGGGVKQTKLSIRNTLVKTVLDQTIGAVINTYLFCAFVTAFKVALTQSTELDELGGKGADLRAPDSTLDSVRVYWSLVLSGANAEFLPLLIDGWKLWPAVSLVGFALLKSVEARNLLVGVTGLCWGIYISIYTLEK